jgi:hypothetical protein
MEQWFKDNWLLVTEVGFVASLITAAGFFRETILATVAFCWRRVTHLLTKRGTAPRPDLRFVAIPWRCMISVVHRVDEQPNADIRTLWNVTNASTSGIPATLLTARLVKPRLRDRRLGSSPFESTNAVVIDVDGDRIAPGTTRKVAVHFFVVLPANRLNSPIKVKIVATDQLSNKHWLPSIAIRPLVIPPPK